MKEGQPMKTEQRTDRLYQHAKEVYGDYGVNTDEVLAQLASIPISLHCWQGDDVGGFENAGEGLSGGGIMATGNYPGKARNGEELRRDLERAMSLIPGKTRLNLHAIYAEFSGKKVERDQLTIDHFRNWLDWAKQKGVGLDFNPTFFSHELAGSGYTLSSNNPEIRSFWVEHAKRCREIAAVLGRELGSPTVNNIWIPDGSKDLPVDRLGPRIRLKESLDEIFAVPYDRQHLVDAVESKLFGIGSEAYVVGSHEFYMGYVMQNEVVPCLDMGHFHPTEGIADKVTALRTFGKNILIHVSRGVRWDSDHVALLNDDLIALALELKRSDSLARVYFALDFFDASINRITAWVTGARALLKALLFALLEPTDLLAQAEKSGNYGDRLALMEEFKALPWGAVWEHHCQNQAMPGGAEWLRNVNDYAAGVLAKRR
jgi:L-rhamnose isomerase